MRLEEWEVLLMKNDPAPFDGVLVPEDAYRYYQLDAAIYPDCRERIDKAVASCQEIRGESASRPWQFAAVFTLGLLVGFVSAEKLR